MIKKTIKRINRRRYIRFNRNKYCPKCDSVLTYNEKEKFYTCPKEDCFYKCDEYGSEIFNTSDCVNTQDFEDSEFINDYQNIFNL